MWSIYCTCEVQVMQFPMSCVLEYPLDADRKEGWLEDSSHHGKTLNDQWDHSPQNRAHGSLIINFTNILRSECLKSVHQHWHLHTVRFTRSFIKGLLYKKDLDNVFTCNTVNEEMTLRIEIQQERWILLKVFLQNENTWVQKVSKARLS